MKMLSLPILAIGVIFVGSAHGVEPWPQEIKAEVRKGCAVGLTSGGFRADRASEICACFADGVERNWPIEEYGKLLAAMDDPPTSEINLKNAEIMRSCL